MIESIAKAFVEMLKLAPRYLVAVGLMAGLLLFSPKNALKNLGLFDLAQHYRPVIAAVFIFCCAMSMVSIVTWIVRPVNNSFRAQIIRRRITKRLNALSENEKQILRIYIGQQTRTHPLQFDDSTAQGLVAAGILQIAGHSGYINAFPHSITETAWNHLNKHKALLAH